MQANYQWGNTFSSERVSFRAPRINVLDTITLHLSFKVVEGYELPFAHGKSSIAALSRWTASAAKLSKHTPSKRHWWKKSARSGTGSAARIYCRHLRPNTHNTVVQRACFDARTYGNGAPLVGYI